MATKEIDGWTFLDETTPACRLIAKDGTGRWLTSISWKRNRRLFIEGDFDDGVTIPVAVLAELVHRARRWRHWDRPTKERAVT